ncbi:hypothetical protein NH8B_2661 [Pseudogulbenkiania sp. NH8B]|uniref:hypothetical protein n=1 Tax=Pseudogulbenkiania sp. (strain NH8B) TaxID=748280 RepID=UPI0002279A5B|nr:hypothetical protein [Pseudogulbenkiania sp. NH8B]BAK77460.1 hypothetical protein NH8B_2661 [Pseudogulbenkiania sp. NH8B]
MLATLCADDFIGLVGQYCSFQSEHHPELTLQIQAVKLRPQAQTPSATSRRTPFVVELAASPNTTVVDAVGRLTLPGHGTVETRQLDLVWIGRVIPAGRDPSLAYFQLPFN